MNSFLKAHTRAHINKHTAHTSHPRLDEVQELPTLRSSSSNATPTVKRRKGSRKDTSGASPTPGQSGAPSSRGQPGDPDKFWMQDKEPLGAPKITGQFTHLSEVEKTRKKTPINITHHPPRHSVLIYRSSGSQSWAR